MLGKNDDEWTEERLFEEICQKAGDKGLKTFLIKLEELRGIVT